MDLPGAVPWPDRTGPLAAEAEAGLLRRLSPTEGERLSRISSARRRAEFLAGRWLLRHLLAETLGGDARDWSLTASDDGPPRAPAHAGVHLALSHSGHWVAGAVSATPAGLDVETPGRARDVLALAAGVCTPAEQARLRALPAAARDAAFREVWTLKEAWLKRRAEGVSPGRLAAVATREAGRDAWTWTSPEVTLAWSHSQGAPRWGRGEDVFGGRAPTSWGIDDAMRPPG